MKVFGYKKKLEAKNSELATKFQFSSQNGTFLATKNRFSHQKCYF